MHVEHIIINIIWIVTPVSTSALATASPPHCWTFPVKMRQPSITFLPVFTLTHNTLSSRIMKLYGPRTSNSNISNSILALLKPLPTVPSPQPVDCIGFCRSHFLGRTLSALWSPTWLYKFTKWAITNEKNTLKLRLLQLVWKKKTCQGFFRGPIPLLGAIRRME